MTGRVEAAIHELAEALLEAARSEAEAGPRTPDKLLSVDEASAALGVGRTALYAEIQAGRVRSVKVGRRRLIPSSAIGERIAR